MSIPDTVYKAHATGNDFIVYEDESGRFDPTPAEVRALCDRHRGIGADGVLRLARSRAIEGVAPGLRHDCMEAGAMWFMDYRNADGSLAEMCGNGTRAIILVAQRLGLVPRRVGAAFPLGTRAGVKTLTFLGDVEPYGRNVFRVDMGRWRKGEDDSFDVTIPGTRGEAHGTFVDMGNPHVVAVLGGSDPGPGAAALPALEELDLVAKPVVSPVLESDQNVEFVRIDGIDDVDDGIGRSDGSDGSDGRAASPDRIGRASMRVNERGVGETLSCGTGLCATGVVLRARTGVSHWDVTVRGGVLRVDVDDEHVELTGSATIVGRIALL